MKKRDEWEEGMHMKKKGSDSTSSIRDEAPTPLKLGRSNESRRSETRRNQGYMIKVTPPSWGSRKVGNKHKINPIFVHFSSCNPIHK